MTPYSVLQKIKYTLPSNIVKLLTHLPPNFVKWLKWLFYLNKDIATSLLQVQCVTLSVAAARGDSTKNAGSNSLEQPYKHKISYICTWL